MLTGWRENLANPPNSENMNKVKVNIFISHAPEDKPQLQVLLKWLYPCAMRSIYGTISPAGPRTTAVTLANSALLV
jgi:hypothetical protein